MKSCFSFSGIMIILLCSCAGSQLGSRRAAEGTHMVIQEKKETITYAMLKQRSADGMLAGEPKARGIFTPDPLSVSLISIAANGVKSMIASEQRKYQAQYSFALNDLYFYDHTSQVGSFDPVGMQFNGFSIVRTFKNAGKLDTALTASFELDMTHPEEIIQNGVFKLKLKEIHINYAKAKVLASAAHAINLDMEIRFLTSYIGAQGELFSNVNLGTFYLSLRQAPLNKRSKTYDAYYRKLEGISLTGRSFIVPRSYSYRINTDNTTAPVYSQGAYSILVSVKESSKNVFADKVIIDNSGTLIDAMGKGVNLKYKKGK